MKDEYLQSKIELKERSEDAPFTPGHLLGGQYKVMNLLGAGGMGSVYKVLQIFSNKNFALKVLDIERIFDEVQIRRFQLEARATHMLDHPNLVKVHDFGVLDSNQPYLIMDFIAGRTIADYIKEFGPLDIQDAVRVFVQVCFGLMHAHENSIVHRDIKPSNIMLVDGLLLGAEGSVKILDFGIAKLLDREGGEIQQLTRTGEVFGSPLYMSPEQCSGTGIDHRSDIYSLGCVIFEALTGTPPHVGSNALRTLMLHQTEEAPTLRMAGNGKSFPPELEAIVAKMLQKSPNTRYQDLGAVIQDLSFFLHGSSAPKAPLKLKVNNKLEQTKKEKAPHTVSLPIYVFVAIALTIATLTSIATSTVLSVLYPKADINVAAMKKLIPPPPDPTLDYSGDKQPDFYEVIRTAGPPPEKLKAFQQVIESSPMVHATRVGKESIELNFPPEFAFGHVRELQITPEGYCKIVGDPVAHGTVKIKYAKGKELGLKIEASKFMTPLFASDTLKIIEPDVFYELAIKGVPSFSKPEHGLTLAKHLDYATRWTGLQRIQLSELPLTAVALRNLLQMPHLKTIAISSPMIDETKTLPHEFWTKLDEVSLIGMQSTDILKKLASSNNLQRLYLEDADVSAEGLAALNSCPRFTHLDFIAGSVDDSVIEALSKVKPLRFLNLETARLTLSQLQTISKAKNLQAIGVSPSSGEALKDLKDSRFYITRERDD